MKTVLVIILLALAAFAGYAAMQPADYTVTRSLVMNAQASTIFPHINNLHQWETWSPWAKLDPNATTTYAGPMEGKDASMSWSGNMQVGAGTMTITDSKPSESIQFRLDFTKPMKGTNTAEFTLKPESNTATTVIWTMSGHKDFLAKAVGVIMNCEKIVGEQFDKGLANLQTVVEAEAPAAGQTPAAVAPPTNTQPGDTQPAD